MRSPLDASHRHEPHEIPARTMVFSVLAGPVAAALVMLLALFTLREDCGSRVGLTRLALVVLAGVVAAAGGTVAWRNWRLVRDAVPRAAGGPAGRNRFFSALAVAGNGLGVLLAAAWLGVVLLLDRCLVS
jgi:hypothetical protein